MAFFFSGLCCIWIIFGKLEQRTLTVFLFLNAQPTSEHYEYCNNNLLVFRRHLLLWESLTIHDVIAEKAQLGSVI